MFISRLPAIRKLIVHLTDTMLDRDESRQVLDVIITILEPTMSNREHSEFTVKADEPNARFSMENVQATITGRREGNWFDRMMILVSTLAVPWSLPIIDFRRIVEGISHTNHFYVK